MRVKQNKILETERLVLRKFNKNDLTDFYKTFSREEVVKYLPLAPLSKKEAAEKLDNIIKNGKIVDLALIDAVIVNESYIGSRALWHPEHLEEIFVTRSTSHDIGMVSIAGRLAEVKETDEGGIFLSVGENGKLVKAAIAPGVIKNIPVSEWRKVKQGEIVELKAKRRIIALDGERELVVKKNEKLSMQLSYAPVDFLEYEDVLKLADSKNMLEVK